MANIKEIENLLKQEHLWRVKSEIKMFFVSTEEELKNEIAKLNLLKVKYEVIKMW